jgi:cytochrome c biogenesis protein CcdA
MSEPACRLSTSLEVMAAAVSARKTLLATIVTVLLGGCAAWAQTPAPAEVTPLVERMPAAAGADLRVAIQVTLPAGLHANANQPRDPSLIPLTVRFGPMPEGVEAAEIVFPEATDLTQRGAELPLRVFDGEFAIGVALKIAPSVPNGSVDVPATLRYQACNELVCFLPVRVPVVWKLTIAKTAGPLQHQDVFSSIRFGAGEEPTVTGNETTSVAPALTGTTPANAAAALTKWEEKGTAAGYLSTGDFLTFISNAERGVRDKGLLDGRGPLAILVIVLLGGLALNLTPCVLPMIPINLAIIGAGAQARSRGRGFLLGSAYGAAMALVYGVLGLVVVLTASTFGTINSYWWFNAGIAVLFVALALAMFDVFVIDFSRFAAGFPVRASSQGSLLVAFGMGAVAALLAGACVAPIVIQVVLFSSDLYVKGTQSALALPFVLGLGMAIPWPIAGAGIAALPRPGAWMVRLKQALGVMILATGAYYGYEAYSILSNRWVDAAEVSSSVQEKLKSGWYASLAEGLTVAERENKPVLVDMWATWCKNCLVMDRTTLEDPAVKTALAGYVKVKFQAEDPDDPAVAGVMRALNAKGLPTYVILHLKQ